MTKQATYKGTVIASSDQTVLIEGTHYFPPDAVRREFLLDSTRETVCPWKGTANYYTVEVDGARDENAAWVYRQPLAAAAEIQDHIAFWHDVEVSDV